MRIVLRCLNLILVFILAQACAKGVVDIRTGESVALVSTLNDTHMVKLWKNTSAEDTITVGDGALKYVGTVADYTDYYRSYKFDSTSGLDYNNGFVFSGTRFGAHVSVYRYDELLDPSRLCNSEEAGTVVIREHVPVIDGETKVYARLDEGDYYLAFKIDEDPQCNYTKEKIKYRYRRVASSSKAFAIMKKDASNTVATFGNSTYGGARNEVYPEGGLTTTEENKPIYIASSENAFAVLKKDGNVATWFNNTICKDKEGVEGKCGVPYDLISGNATPNAGALTSNVENKDKIVALFSNYYAYVALKEDGSIATWGLNAYGGDFVTFPAHPKGSLTASGTEVPEGKKVVTIISNRYSFTAIKEDGSISTWGGDYDPARGTETADQNADNYGSNYLTSAYPANVPTDVLPADGSAPAQGHKVIEVVPSEGAFVAILQDGSLVSWGDKGFGGSFEEHYPAGTLSNFAGTSGVNLHGVVGSSKSFAVLNKAGRLASFGNVAYGGNLTTHLPEGSISKTFTRVFPGYMSFSAIASDGLITTWGDIKANYTGDNTIFGSGNIKKFVPARSGYIAERESVHARWVIPTSSANLALLENGTVIAWGNNSQGGSIRWIYPAGAFDYIGNSDTNSIYQVYSNWDAFATVKVDGSLITWGKRENTDKTPASGNWESVEPATQKDLKFTGPTEIVRIYNTSFAFLAEKADGSFMVWGNADAGGSINGHTPEGSLANYRIEE